MSGGGDTLIAGSGLQVVPADNPRCEDWTIVGPPLDDAGLRRRIQAALERIEEDLGRPPVERDLRDATTARTALEDARDEVSELLRCSSARGRSPKVARLADALIELEELLVDLSQARARLQGERYAKVQAALARLRAIGTLDKMMERAPAELCRCGFDRAILSSVEGSRWNVETVHVNDDSEWAARIADAARAAPRDLDHMLAESEMMRRRAPILVPDVQNDPRTNAVIGAASRSQSYVAAPIMPEGRVIGFLHADCYSSRRDVDEEDMAVLWLFAEGFGFAFQRTSLLDRLRRTRDEVHTLTRSLALTVDDVCGSRTTLSGHVAGEMAAAIAAPVMDTRAPVALGAPESRVEAVLSRREIEVLELMASGLSNGQIAEQLVIGAGTVKSHVKHILRKLHATNRAEAVFRFMRLMAIDEKAGAAA